MAHHHVIKNDPVDALWEALDYKACFKSQDLMIDKGEEMEEQISGAINMVKNKVLTYNHLLHLPCLLKLHTKKTD